MYPVNRIVSQSGSFVIDISKEYVDAAGQRLYAAVIMEKVRSYYQPVLQGIAITENEIERYKAKWKLSWLIHLVGGGTDFLSRYRRKY